VSENTHIYPVKSPLFMKNLISLSFLQNCW